jgi:hypothetical protein
VGVPHSYGLYYHSHLKSQCHQRITLFDCHLIGELLENATFSYSIFSLGLPMTSSADHCRTTTRDEVSNM